MKTIKKLGILLGLFAFMSLNAQEVTDYDLQNFAKAYKEMMLLSSKAQNEMTEIIEKEGMELEVYHAINASKDADADFEPDVSADNYKKFDKIQPKIQAVQDRLEADVEKAYLRHDLSKQDYRAIAERVKMDQLLQIKLEKMMGSLR